jgi:NADH:ubiquinone oxidoreductase subunit 6 (subunit J)
MNEYVLVFELLGVILLVVLIGAASMARRNK